MNLMDEVTARALSLVVPFSLHFDLTYRCNERCVHCYLDHDDHGEMTTDEIKRVLEQAASAGTLILTLSGGEPFLRKDFFDILAYARSLMFAVKIKTNGMLIGAEQARRLRNLNVGEVQISIYSHRAEVHDAITKVGGSLERSLKAIRCLRAEGLNTIISCPLMRGNIDQYPEVEALAAELGVKFTMDPTITPKMDGDMSILSHRIGQADIARVFQDSTLVGDVKEFCKPDDPITGDVLDSVPCTAGHTAVYVSPYGEVFPCVQFPVTCGNVREQPFQEIWLHSERMNQIRSIRVRDLHTCSGCSHVSGCSRCPGLAYMEGDMRGPSSADCEKSMIKAGLAQIHSTPQLAHASLVQIQPIR
jgi:radical SAM protein with 4Fe4S-binding SPASM domain